MKFIIHKDNNDNQNNQTHILKLHTNQNKDIKNNNFKPFQLIFLYFIKKNLFFIANNNYNQYICFGFMYEYSKLILHIRKNTTYYNLTNHSKTKFL